MAAVVSLGTETDGDGFIAYLPSYSRSGGTVGGKTRASPYRPRR